MKLIILRDPLKLDISEGLPGLHGTSILFQKARGNVLYLRGTTATLLKLCMMPI